MILANYRGFPDPSHYLEQAVRALGDKPFAYHGELRPLSRAEADSYLQASLEGGEIEGRQLEQLPDCVDAIYEASEGFPSFMQEVSTSIPLIVGIDPGTTTGLALFDLEGNFLLAESRRNFRKAEIRKFILDQGSPVIIASDINPIPKSIARIKQTVVQKRAFLKVTAWVPR